MAKSIILGSIFFSFIAVNMLIEKSYGRKPAVLPVSGISLDSISPSFSANDQTGPAKANGRSPVSVQNTEGKTGFFKFKESSFAVKNPLFAARYKKSVNTNNSSLSFMGSDGSELVPALILFIILLPIGLWVSLKRSSPASMEGTDLAKEVYSKYTTTTSATSKNESHSAEVISLQSHKEKKILKSDGKANIETDSAHQLDNDHEHKKAS